MEGPLLVEGEFLGQLEFLGGKLFHVDIFEGQLITCVVIVGFILVFLIREWVVQQQPLVNLDNLAHVQAHLRDAAERVQADNERLRRQQELLELARRRLLELQNETNDIHENAMEDEAEPWLGWEALDSMIDHATVHLRGEGEEVRCRMHCSDQ